MTTMFDFTTLKRAIEDRDAETIVGLYAPDAEVRLVDGEHPPSAPRVLRGTAEIAEHHRDACSRDLTHEVSRETLAGDRAAYALGCRYPDGTEVLCVALLELREGLIVGELALQAWDT